LVNQPMTHNDRQTLANRVTTALDLAVL